VPFGLAGLALVGVVLDQIDVPHDNWLSVGVLGGGAVAGAIAGLVLARGDLPGGDGVTRARHAAWTVVRFFLAFEMVRYGMAKVIGMQFYPQYWRLDSRTVDLKPSWLAWAFFGRTYGYQAFGGLLEVASAVLVCFRRTTLLGACLMAAVLTDVVLVNIFYDVPVKLFASVYLALAVSLIAREAPRLRAFFLQPSREGPKGVRPRALRAVGITLVLMLPAADTLRDAYRYGIFRTEPLEGAWRVDRRSGLDDLLPETPGPWDRIYFEKGDFGFVRVGRERVHFATRIDDATSTLTLSRFGGEQSLNLEGSFALHDQSLHVEGNRGGKPFALDLTREFPR